jgi:hypothetical protein
MALKQNTSLRSLVLKNNQIRGNDAKVLAKILHLNSRLKKIRLRVIERQLLLPAQWYHFIQL